PSTSASLQPASSRWSAPAALRQRERNPIRQPRHRRTAVQRSSSRIIGYRGPEPPTIQQLQLHTIAGLCVQCLGVDSQFKLHLLVVAAQQTPAAYPDRLRGFGLVRRPVDPPSGEVEKVGSVTI